VEKSIAFQGHVKLGVFGGAWSRDSRLLYYCGFAPDGRGFIGAVDLSSDEQKIIYRFSDPLRQLYRYVIVPTSKDLFFTLGSRESDVWVMELNRK
jgi:hypothetical protein